MTQEQLALVHINLWSPMQQPMHNGKWWMLTITNDFTQKVWVELLSWKSEITYTFKI